MYFGLAALVFLVGHILLDLRGLFHRFESYAPWENTSSTPLCKGCEQRHKHLFWTIAPIILLGGHLAFDLTGF